MIQSYFMEGLLISEIDQKIISMYAKGMSTTQISDIIRDIYGFDASEGFISVPFTVPICHAALERQLGCHISDL